MKILEYLHFVLCIDNFLNFNSLPILFDNFMENLYKIQILRSEGFYFAYSLPLNFSIGVE